MEPSISKYLGFTYAEVVEALMEEGVNLSVIPKHLPQASLREERIFTSEKQQLLRH